MSEHDEQTALFQWRDLSMERFPELEMMFAVPNGGKRHIKTAMRMKEEGQQKGVPDVWLPVPHGGYFGMVFEMKYGKNKCTPDQRRWLENLADIGWKTGVYWNWEDARDAVEDYIGLD